ncbi:MAG TPA: hypothetical protein VIM61_02115 [Chthoniobacterales bacterium]
MVNTALLVRYLGPESLGLLITVWSTLLWGNLFNLGVTGALVNRLAVHVAGRDEGSYRRDFGSGAVLILAIGLGLAVVLGMAILLLPLRAVFPVSDPNLVAALPGVLSAGGMAFVSLFLSSFCYPEFAARGRLATYFRINTAASVVNCVAVALACGLQQPLWVCAVALLVSGNLWLLLGSLWAISLRTIGEALRAVRWGAIRELIASSKPFFLIQLSTIVLFSCDAFIIAHAQSFENVTLYSSINRLFLLGFTLAGGIIAPLYPALRSAVVKEDWTWVTGVARRMSLSAVGFLGVLVAVGVWPIPEIAKIWLSLPAAAPWLLCVLLGLATGMRLLADVFGQLILAAERMRTVTVVAICAPVIYLGFALLMVRVLGVIALPIAAVLAFGFSIAVAGFNVQSLLQLARAQRTEFKRK